MTDKKTLSIRIIGHKLPGLKFGRTQGATIERKPVYLGMQRKDQVIDLVPGNVPKAVFNFTVDVISNDGLDFRGPFVHGVKGKRFLYLSWGEVANGNFSMFRRAKLHLSAINPKDISHALDANLVVEGSLDLTDEKGGPICGTVAKKISWQIVR